MSVEAPMVSPMAAHKKGLALNTQALSADPMNQAPNASQSGGVLRDQPAVHAIAETDTQAPEIVGALLVAAAGAATKQGANHVACGLQEAGAAATAFGGALRPGHLEIRRVRIARRRAVGVGDAVGIAGDLATGDLGQIARRMVDVKDALHAVGAASQPAIHAPDGG